METNRLEGRVTCKGTRDMLYEWRQTVSPVDQHVLLKSALLGADLVHLAHTFLNDIEIPTEDVPIDACECLDCGLADKLIANLADDIEHEQHVKILGQKLGFEKNDIIGYLAKNRVGGRVTSEGTRAMLFEWRQRVSPSSQHEALDGSLRQAGLIFLAEKYLRVTYIPTDFIKKRISKNLSTKQCREKLMTHYKRTLKVQLSPWKPRHFRTMEDLHTKISLHRKEVDIRGERTRKIPIVDSVNGIFTVEVDGCRPTHVLLVGAAGSGKTTAIEKIAHDWANQAADSPYSDIPLLFALKFRNTSKPVSLGDAIITQLLGNDVDVTADELERFIRDNGEHCWVLLDGYDEFSESITNHVCSGPMCGDTLIDILLFKRFTKCHVLVTTRPHRRDDFDRGYLPKVYVEMEIEGFAEEDVDKYIACFFGRNSSQCEQLKIFLKGHHIISPLVKTPFFCMALCTLWQGGFLKETKTMTQLFDNLLKYMVQHLRRKVQADGERSGYSESRLKSALASVGRVAWESLINDNMRLVFSSDDFRSCPEDLSLCIDLGLLSKQTCEVDGEWFEDQSKAFIEFYHKLGQEHSAGAYLSSMDMSESRSALFRLDTKDKVLDLENVLQFAAGGSTGAPVVGHTLLSHVVGLKWVTVPADVSSIHFLDPEYDSHRICLNILGEGLGDDMEAYRGRLPLRTDTHDEELDMETRQLTTILRPQYEKGEINIHSLSGGMIRGLERLPAEIKQMIRNVSIYYSDLRDEIAHYFWKTLTGFRAIDILDIRYSSLHLPSHSSCLPAVRLLRASYLSSASYGGVIGSLSRLKEIKLHLACPDADIAGVARGLNRAGDFVRYIKLSGVFPEIGVDGVLDAQPALSDDTVACLCDAIRDRASRLEKFELEFVTTTEKSLMTLVETCRAVGTMRKIWIWNCGDRMGGRLHSHLKSLYQLKGAVLVNVFHCSTKIEGGRYFVSHIQHGDPAKHTCSYL